MSLESLNLDWNVVIMWCALGFGSGLIAKILLPGKDKGGLISTTVIGIMGAFLGGVIGNHFNITTQVGGITFLSVLTAVVGALAVLIVFRVLKLLI